MDEFATQEAPSGIVDESKEQARRVGGIAKQRVLRAASQRKDTFAQTLEQLADMLEGLDPRTGERGLAGEAPSKLAEQGALYLRRATRMFKDQSVEELIDRAEMAIRARPGAVMAACVAAGFLGARFLKR